MYKFFYLFSSDDDDDDEGGGGLLHSHGIYITHNAKYTQALMNSSVQTLAIVNYFKTMQPFF